MNPEELTRVGPYRVRRFVAEGGMAWVFEVVDPRFDAVRALKMLKPEAAAGGDVRRFEAEANLLAGIDHPNLVTIYDFGRDEATGCHYYTMTYVDGPTLSQRGVLPPSEAGPLFLDVLAGLAMLHDRGIVHRDIKPANVLLTDDGRALLADLGIARRTDQAGVTRTGTAIGTALYMAPEQARGRDVTPRVDVFAMGLSLYQVLTGHTVYDDLDEVDTTSGQDILLYMGSLLHAGRELTFRFPPHVPPALRRVIETACRLEPERRYADARTMHEALYTALYESTRPAPRRGLRTALAVAALAVAGAAALVFWPDAAAERARERLEQVDGLERRAGSLLFAAATLEPPPPGALLARLREDVSSAQVFRNRGREALDAGRPEEASASLERAQSAYAEACAELVSGFLGARAEGAVGDVPGRAELYRSAGGPDLAPQSWPGLELALERLAPPDAALPACGRAEAELGRIAASDGARAALAAVETDLARELPRVAGVARTSAEAARRAASEQMVDVGAFREALVAGRRGLERGDARREEGDWIGALDDYRGAEAAFERARAIAPAARLRARAEGLEERARASMGDVGLVDVALDEARSRWEAERWDEAAHAYEKALELLESLLADLEASRDALAAAGAARREREAALAAGAERSAAAELGTGDALRESADAALRAKQYPAAERDFAAASEAFGRARERAVAALAEARSVRAAARTAADALPDACGALSEAAARDCAAARAALAAGETALDERDAARALANLRLAEERAARAEETERAYLAELPRPPRITARTPAADRVTVHRGEPVALSVRASDPNGDALRYVWTVDGRETEARGASFELAATADARVRVRVDDGQGGAATADWQLVFENRPPELRLYPDGPRVHLELGGRRTFRAEARDPDGEAVRTEFLVDGRPVAAGESFDFAPEQAGTFVVAVRAVDASGARSELERRVEVTAPRAPDPVPAPPRTVDPEQGALAALERYRTAYEARDLESLARVWIMNPKQREAMAQLFEHADAIDVAIERQGTAVSGEIVSIDFDQAVRATGPRMTSNAESVAMTATVIHTGGGDWKISSILPRR